MTPPDPRRDSPLPQDAVPGVGQQIYFGACVAPDAAFRSIWFSAASEQDARQFCVEGGFALVGPAAAPPGVAACPTPEPDVLVAEEAMRLLGVSRSTLYRLVCARLLKRLPGVAAIRITRRSLEDYLDSAR